MGIDLASLSLFPATPEQVLESRKRTFPQWGRGLTLDQYLRRDAAMDVHEHAKGKLTTWVLADRTDHTSLDFFCSCESFKRQALQAPNRTTTAQWCVAYGIASVYTPPHNRGRGYARHMMRLLHWVLADGKNLPEFPVEWGMPPTRPEEVGDGLFSALWSDVGSKFYLSCGMTLESQGWEVRSPQGTIFIVEDLQRRLSSGSVPARKVPEMTLLSPEETSFLWINDTIYIEEQLSNHSSDVTRVSFTPIGGVGAYTSRRTSFFIPGSDEEQTLKHWGVKLNIEGESPTYVTWCIEVDPPPTKLLITRLRSEPRVFLELMHAVLIAAQELNMEKIEIWNLPSQLVAIAGELGGVTAFREDHLPSLAWYGPPPSSDVEWMFNEKFPWC
ncbi:hypothetical protein SISSUDRAFT_739119 [Sistotremastrum suecicum HHB10207 ss-3]|uniref:LYC1 C-terminal domain-containing protein n=1 Tax=Sistotremastrum suecicum HHB10207 ss-3 TaxID=1314776 RepID=A0A166HV27_9AGAM|nr:hypothetical protein SISSUDRAFT_739119 [Sistotremastrum suecicum HHB10207 ss-3]